MSVKFKQSIEGYVICIYVYTVFRAKSLLKLACKNLENIFNFVTSGGDSVIPYSFVSFLVSYLYLCFLGV